jgi:hypothetical protein
MGRENVKRVIIFFIVILILIGGFFGVFAYINYEKPVNQPVNTTNLTNVTNAGKNHYEDNNISFDYPDGWNISKDKVTPPLVVTVAKDGNNSLSVFKETLGIKSFRDRLLEWRNNINSQGNINYEGNVTTDGTVAYDVEATFKNGNGTYNTRGIALQKNGTAYFIVFVFNKSLLMYKNEMETVINSFHVK